MEPLSATDQRVKIFQFSMMGQVLNISAIRKSTAVEGKNKIKKKQIG